LDSVQLPIGFRSLQAADLSDWQPRRPSPRLHQLIQDISAVLKTPARPPQIKPRTNVKRFTYAFVAILLALAAWTGYWRYQIARELPAKTAGTVFAHLFEWTWNDIALECKDFLGPNGYGAVQISPPNEHRLLLGRPWYERYQPVSYKLTSRSGTRQEFIQMIQQCHQAGVQIYADVVINHMASCRPDCDAGQPQYGNRGVGGSLYEVGRYRFNNLFDTEDRNRVAGALDAYQPQHFHRGCPQVSDWTNVEQVQNCELERLADLATEREDVRNTLANYLVALLKLGVDGLRIDAALHLPQEDLHAILTKAATAANVRIQGTEINPAGARTVLVLQEVLSRPPDLPAMYGNGKVLEVVYGSKLAEIFLGGLLRTLNGPLAFCEGWGLQPSRMAIAFIDTHDTQRGHGGSAQIIKDIRNNLPAYRLANIFMLAWPYGYPHVMSSYRFGKGELWLHEQNAEQTITSVVNIPVHDDFLGPPHNGVHKSVLQRSDYATASDWTTRRVWVNEGGQWRNTCFDDQSKWLCEHRWRPIANMVGFRNAVNANWAPVANWWSNGQRQIAFGRGHLGFVLINAELGTDPHTVGPESNGWIQTGLPAGRYCDVIHSNLAPDHTRCLTENRQDLPPVTVYPGGRAHVRVDPMDAVALHVGAKLQGDNSPHIRENAQAR
jgi:alpha-amylase